MAAMGTHRRVNSCGGLLSFCVKGRRWVGVRQAIEDGHFLRLQSHGVWMFAHGPALPWSALILLRIAASSPGKMIVVGQTCASASPCTADARCAPHGNRQRRPKFKVTIP